MVTGGKNEDNYALVQSNSNGTWTIYSHDNGDDATTYEPDPIGFVYIPNGAGYVSGRFDGNGQALMANGNFALKEIGGGVYELTVTGYTPSQGVLLLSPEGGIGANVDNIVSYQAVGSKWVIHTRDLPGATLQDLGTNPLASFVFIPFVDAVRPKGTISSTQHNVVQNDTGNATSSVDVTVAQGSGDFIVRAGSNRGDYLVQSGALGTDFANGVMITSVSQNGRDNGEGGVKQTANDFRVIVDGVYYGTYTVAPGGNIRTFGGDGNDTVTIIGTSGNDTITVGADVVQDSLRDKVFALNGVNYTTHDIDNYMIRGGDGADTFNIEGLGFQSLPTPTTNNITLQGGLGDDVLNTTALTAGDVASGLTAGMDVLLQDPNAERWKVF